MGGDNAMIDARSVGCGGDDAAKRLVGDGADVDHGKTVFGKFGVEGVEGDAGLGDDVAFVDVDLRGVRGVSGSTGSAYLQEAVELCGAEHVAGGACEVAGGVADADCTDDPIFAAGLVEDEPAVVHVLGLEYGEGGTCKRAAPVGEAGGRHGWVASRTVVDDIRCGRDHFGLVRSDGLGHGRPRSCQAPLTTTPSCQ